MLQFVAFVVVWLMVATLFAAAINTYRAKNNQNINDKISSFLEGVVWGPIGVLSSFDPKERAIGRSTPKLFGGIVGSIVAYNVFSVL